MTEIQDGQTQTYEETKLLVHKVTHDFLRRKGISEQHYEEWHAEACLAFSQAHRSCDPTRARFTTWLWHSIWNGLSEKLRREAFHHSLARLNGNARSVPDHRRSVPWSACEFLESLTEDAKTVAMLVLSGTGSWNGREPEEVRSFLADLLRRLGWTWDRIEESFREMREALSR